MQLKCTLKNIDEELEVKPVHELNLFEIKVADFCEFCMNELDIKLMDIAKYPRLPITIFRNFTRYLEVGVM